MIRTLTVLVAVAVFGAVVLLIRRRALHEEYALAWLGGIGVIGLVAAIPGLLESIADVLGIANPPNALIGFVILVLAIVALRQQVEISRLSDHTRSLAQELALHRAQEPQTGNGADLP